MSAIERLGELPGFVLGYVLIAATVTGCVTPDARFVKQPLPLHELQQLEPKTEDGASVVRSQNPGAWGNYQPRPQTSPTWGNTYPAPSAASSWNNGAATPNAGQQWSGAPAQPVAWNQPTSQIPSWNNQGTVAPAAPVSHGAIGGNSQAQFAAPAQAGPQPGLWPNGGPAPVPGFGQPVVGQPPVGQPPVGQPPVGQPALGQPAFGQPAFGQPVVAPVGIPNGGLGVPTPLTDIIVNASETQTGRLLIGAAVNSDAGVTGQIVLDEKNFDWRRFPRSWDDLPNAFRGGGQTLRIEALPGSEVQRYMVQFTQPYLFNTRVSFNFSGFLFDRRYFDWDESRLGGRFGFGYRVTPDLSVQLSFRAAEVEITDARVPGVPDLEEALGDNELYGIQFGITQDTRDIPFAPTQGYYLDLNFEQVLGTYDYSRGTVDYRRYFLVTERPDGSGRQVLGFSNRVALSGSQTPIYDRYFAGGYSTLRGFDFRGATPLVSGVAVGGQLSILGSVEYRFPVTADDMLQAVVFCDYGTIEEEIDIDWDDYRVSLGAGLRVSVPALSAAPIALDLAVPIAREDTDDIQNFAFFVGVSR